jgi:hypothetical protein
MEEVSIHPSEDGMEEVSVVIYLQHPLEDGMEVSILPSEDGMEEE